MGQVQLASMASSAAPLTLTLGCELEVSSSTLADGVDTTVRGEGTARSCARAVPSTLLSVIDSLRPRLLTQQLSWLLWNDSTLVASTDAFSSVAGVGDLLDGASSEADGTALVEPSAFEDLTSSSAPQGVAALAVASAAHASALATDNASLDVGVGGGLLSVTTSALQSASVDTAAVLACAPCETQPAPAPALRMLILFAGRRRPKSLRRSLERLGVIVVTFEHECQR